MPNLHRKIQNRSKKGLLYWKTGRILQKLNGTLGKTPKLKWKIQNSSKKTQGFSKSTWSTCWKLIQKKAGLTPRLVVWKTWFYLFSIFERCSYFFQDKEANYFVNQLPNSMKQITFYSKARPKEGRFRNQSMSLIWYFFLQKLVYFQFSKK